jgi:hypothetical protein
MKIGKHSVMLTAALTGLLSGTMARLDAAHSSSSSTRTISSMAGQLSTAADAATRKTCLPIVLTDSRTTVWESADPPLPAHP